MGRKSGERNLGLMETHVETLYFPQAGRTASFQLPFLPLPFPSYFSLPCPLPWPEGSTGR